MLLEPAYRNHRMYRQHLLHLKNRERKLIVQWDQCAATTVPLLIAVGGATWRLWKQRQKEHKENREMLEAILYDQLYLIPHDHIESRIPGDENIPLTRGGIIRRPNGASPKMKRGGTT